LALPGFGHIEVGTLTLSSQEGNEKPRLFRLRDDGGLINQMGFPSRGIGEVMKLEARREIGPNYILGVSIGKPRSTPLEQAFNDYVLIMTQTYHVADYFAINVSSPNTPGLRELQCPRYLKKNLLDSVHHANNELALRNKRSAKLGLLKISLDLSESEIDLLLDTALSGGISGIIAANTTSEREKQKGFRKRQIGGLSGRPLVEKRNRIISYIHEVIQGDLPIIGAGGVFNGDNTRRKMDAGASLVQLYTGLIYEGSSIVSNILQDL
jgi:dihydroorotate dehydrogenase